MNSVVKSTSKVKIGLFGIGKMGQNHLRILNMLRNVEIAFIYDTNAEACQKLSEQFGVKVLADLNELDFELKNCNGVIIVTPTFTHFDYINKVSDYVNNIFVEKPLTNTLESSQIIVDLAKQKSLNIQVGFIERYNPAVLTLKKIIAQASKVINIDFIRTNKMSSRITDCDVVIDLMIHDIDLALNFNGEVAELYAHGVVVNDMIEYARAVIVHKNGAFSNIVASRITEKRIRQISVTTEFKYIDCNLLSKELFVNKQSVEQRFNSVSISANMETIEVSGQEALLSELISFTDLCRESSVNADLKGVDSKNAANVNQNASYPNQDDGMAAMQLAHKIQKIIYEKHKSQA